LSHSAAFKVHFCIVSALISRDLHQGALRDDDGADDADGCKIEIFDISSSPMLLS
jgi:hypothetical protein